MEKRGIDEYRHGIIYFKTAITASGRLQQVRQQQSVEWLRKQIEEEVLNHLFANEDFIAITARRYNCSKTILFTAHRPAAAQ